MSANYGLKYVKADGTLTPAGLQLFIAQSGGGGTATWGGITGSIGAQADLQGELDNKADSSHTHVIGDITGLSAALGSALLKTYETVSKNLDASNATLAYSGSDLSTITYANGIVKTFGYSGGNLVTVTLSGATPSGITLVKTLSYTGTNLTGVAYS